MIGFIIGILFCLWIIFFGGAAKLENSILGYFEFELAAQKEKFIKILAWAYLVVCALIISGVL